MLTSTESIVGQWKEYFEDLLNSTDKHSEDEAEPEEFGLGFPITGATGAVKQLYSSNAQVLDEIYPECCEVVRADMLL